MFVDDIILFGRANPVEAKNLQCCLAKYEKWSGQTINTQKFGIFYSPNINSRLCGELYSILGLNMIRDDVKYLGIPMFLTKNKAQNFKFLISQVHSRIQGWKRKSLS